MKGRCACGKTVEITAKGGVLAAHAGADGKRCPGSGKKPKWVTGLLQDVLGLTDDQMREIEERVRRRMPRKR